MDAATLVLAFAAGVFFVASLCQSITGFGFALVAVPVLSLVIGPKDAVVTSTLLGTALSVLLIVEVGARVPARPVLLLLAGAFVGAPLGAVLLDRIDADLLTYVISVMVIASAAAVWRSGSGLRLGNRTAASLGAGVLSGLLRSATSMGGPPVVLFLLSTEPDRERFRRMMLAFGPLSSVVSIAALFHLGLITDTSVRLTALSLPAMAVGLLAGRYVRGVLPVSAFRSGVLAVLVLTALSTLLLTPLQH